MVEGKIEGWFNIRGQLRVIVLFVTLLMYIFMHRVPAVQVVAQHCARQAVILF